MAKRKPRSEVIPGSDLRIHGAAARAERAGFTGADLKRFKTLFTKAWNRVHPDAGRRILAHWRTAHPKRIPRVYVFPRTPGRDLPEMAVHSDGYRLVFYDHIRDLPDARVEDRVGWALAGVWQFAAGYYRLFKFVKGAEGAVPLDLDEALDAHADRLMEHWGFDPRSAMPLGAIRVLEELEEGVRRKQSRSRGAATPAQLPKEVNP
jgi:hypothetical protein